MGRVGTHAASGSQRRSSGNCKTEVQVSRQVCKPRGPARPTGLSFPRAVLSHRHCRGRDWTAPSSRWPGRLWRGWAGSQAPRATAAGCPLVPSQGEERGEAAQDTGAQTVLRQEPGLRGAHGSTWGCGGVAQPGVLALRQQRQTGHKFKAILSYTISLCLKCPHAPFPRDLHWAQFT